MRRHVCRCALGVAVWLAAACGDDRAGAPPPVPRATVRTVAPCAFASLPARARVASRDPEGPWFHGQAAFEYLRPAPRVDGRHVNHGSSGGMSSVGWRGEALTFELPPNSAMHHESLLRHGPPAAIAYRAAVAGTHHVSIVACRTDRDPPRLDLSTLRRAGGGDPIGTAELAPHPIETGLWESRVAEPRVAHELDVDLLAGDVVRLTAAPVVDARGTLELAFDVAITPPSP